jgi:hypothetical protein
MTTPMTTPVFDENINSVFGKFIKDGRIICSESEFTDGFKRLKKQLKLGGSKKDSDTPRKKSSFMTWLNKDKRQELQDEFFSDFESHSDWSEDGIRQYYQSKSLSLDKLEVLIEKKHTEGKEMKKPRLMALITIKAGIIWSEMTTDEKLPFSDSESKKGRPPGYKAKKYVVDSAITSALNSVPSTINCVSSDEEIELEQFEYEGQSYLKDDNFKVYDLECNEIGTINKDRIVEFNK